jgi:hypothetical protein
MPYDIIFMTTVLPSLIVTGGGVAAIWIITRAWLRYKRSPTADELAQLSESLEVLNHSVEDLREDIRGHMSEMRELSGRVEFAERLLTEKREQ